MGEKKTKLISNNLTNTIIRAHTLPLRQKLKCHSLAPQPFQQKFFHCLKPLTHILAHGNNKILGTALPQPSNKLDKCWIFHLGLLGTSRRASMGCFGSSRAFAGSQLLTGMCLSQGIPGPVVRLTPRDNNYFQAGHLVHSTQ